MNIEYKINKVEYVSIEESLNDPQYGQFVGIWIWDYQTDNNWENWDSFQFFFRNPVNKEDEVIEKYEFLLNNLEEKGRPVIFLKCGDGNLVGVIDDIDKNNEKETDSMTFYFLEPVSDEKELINKGRLFLELIKKDKEKASIVMPTSLLKDIGKQCKKQWTRRAKKRSLS